MATRAKATEKAPPPVSMLAWVRDDPTKYVTRSQLLDFVTSVLSPLVGVRRDPSIHVTELTAEQTNVEGPLMVGPREDDVL